MSKRSVPIHLLVPSWRTCALTAASLAAVLVVLIFILKPSPLMTWYYLRFVAPAVHARFGFSARFDAVNNCLEVVSVAPGGSFALAGVEPGYISAQHSSLGISQPELLYFLLANAHGPTVRLRFFKGGCSSPTEVVDLPIGVPRQKGAA